MKIRICKENRDKLQAALNDAQGNSRERTITVDDIICSIKDVEETLGIPKKSRLHLTSAARTLLIHIGILHIQLSTEWNVLQAAGSLPG